MTRPQAVQVRRRAADTVTITIDRPRRANSLDRTTLEELLDRLSEIRDDEQTRSIVFCGAGRWFISGADIHYLGTITQEEFESFAGLVVDLFRAVRSTPAVTIARIGGAAMGIGLTLALACDLRVATKDARFAHPEATLGFIGGTALLPRATTTPASAHWMLLSGASIDGPQAMQLGLLTDLAESAADIDNVIDRYLEGLRHIDRASISAVKRSVYECQTIADPAQALAAQQRVAARLFDPQRVRRRFAPVTRVAERQPSP